MKLRELRNQAVFWLTLWLVWRFLRHAVTWGWMPTAGVAVLAAFVMVLLVAVVTDSFMGD